MSKISLALGAGACFLAVILGAFGAHYLKTIFTPELLQSFETGVRYQMYHGFALIGLGLYARNSPKIKAICLLFVVGILLFSGSIYALCLLKAQAQIGLGGLGILTPLGGVSFLAGWLLWILRILKEKTH